MAHTLLERGSEFTFHDANFTENHATMKDTDRETTKPSRLQLLQDDYRTRLLREREQKANALFEQKVKADLLPKKGSVREFFLNRRLLVANTTGASNAVNLLPIKANIRYKSKQKDNQNLVEKQLVKDRKKKERMVAETFLEDMEAQVRNFGEKLNRMTKYEIKHQQNVSATTVANNSKGPVFSSTRDVQKSERRKARGVKSREVYKRGAKLSHEDKKNRTSNEDSEEFAPPGTDKKPSKASRGVKSREVYKRGTQPAEEHNTERRHRKESSAHRNSEDVGRTITENDLVSRSLVKIKELVSRRKTDELILRSKTAKLAGESLNLSPRRNSQSFDEMCKLEVKLRETISREQRKLLALQERRRQKVVEYRKESRGRISETEMRSVERKHNPLRQSPDKKTRKNVRKSREDRHQNISTKQKRANLKCTKENSQYEMKDNTDKSASSNEGNVKKQRNTTQAIHSSELTSNVGNPSSSANTMMDLITCSNCGRSFMKDRIAKHEKACRKASSRVKKPFDTKRKRAEGTDMEKYIIIGKDTGDDSPCKETKRDWRREHESFIQAIRSARRQEPQQATPLTNPDYIECSYCGRKFKPAVAERHIPKCKYIKARPRPPRR